MQGRRSRAASGAGIVNKHLRMAEARGRICQCLLQPRVIGNVGYRRQEVRIMQPLGERTQPCLVHVQGDDLISDLNKVRRQPSSDPRCRSSHQHHPAHRLRSSR